MTKGIIAFLDSSITDNLIDKALQLGIKRVATLPAAVSQIDRHVDGVSRFVFSNPCGGAGSTCHLALLGALLDSAVSDTYTMADMVINILFVPITVA